MYTLKVPNQSQFTSLNRTFDTYLKDNNVQMKDRRLVTAYTMGRIIGGSLPVSDLATWDIRSRTYREQMLPTVKAFLDRVGEAVVLDHELCTIGALLEWTRRCTVAFPAQPAVTDTATEENVYGVGQQTAVLAQVAAAYPDLKLHWGLADLLTQKGE